MIVIDANSGPQYWLHIKECWERRSLIGLLSHRDIKVKYTQTFLGMTWAVVNPLISVLLLFFVFNLIAKVDTSGVPPILFTVSGLCAWNYFAKVVAEAGTSIVGAQSLVTKIYFPRLVIPFSKAVSGMVDFAIVFLMLIILMIYYQYPPGKNFWFLIPCILLVIIIGLGAGIWVAALTIRYRDFHYIVPVLLRIGMFISPIAYGTHIVPEKYKWLLSLNPLTGVIDGFRLALFDMPLDYPVFYTSLFIGFVLLVTGIVYFIRMERFIADII